MLQAESCLATHSRLSMSASATYRCASSVAATQVDDTSTVLLHLSTQTYFELNRTGTQLWQYVDEHDGATMPELVEVLHNDREDVSRDEVRAEVQAFLQDLTDAELLEEA